VVVGCVIAAAASAARAAYAENEILGLAKFGGSPGAREMLLEQGFVVTDETYRQICSFYIHGPQPYFITTDSVLYAYFINLEKAVQKLERKHATDLAAGLASYRERLAGWRTEAVWGRRAGDEAPALGTLVESGALDEEWLEAAGALDDYLLVAEFLAGHGAPPAEGAELPTAVRDELELIFAAEGPAKSPLRGVKFDYARFRPYGFYAGDPVLAPYFRAVTWLREVPFRVDDDGETRQALLLYKLYAGEDPGRSVFVNLEWDYQEFLGPSDDAGISDAYAARDLSFGEKAEGNRREWERFRAKVQEIPAPRHTTIPERDAVGDPGLYRGFRLLPRPALYDNDVLALLAPFGLYRPPPTGEELMAVMGSPAARDVVFRREAKGIRGYEELFAKAEAAAAEAEERYNGRIPVTLRDVYRSLLEPPATDDLPAYYLHPNWRYKDLNTCLAGWAHSRYIWDAHAKRLMSYLGVALAPPAFVEPNVRFYEALTKLTAYTQEFFLERDVNEPGFAEVASLLAELQPILRKQVAGEVFTAREVELLENYGPYLAHACGFLGNVWLDDENLPDTPFCVPVAVDLYTERERVVGQARPRAIYVLCEREGETYLTRGGVLSYRDWLGPAWGPGRMTLAEWRDRRGWGRVPVPAWQGRFSSPPSRAWMREELRGGRIHEAMFAAGDAKLGDILAGKLRRGDEFEFCDAPPRESRDGHEQAILLFRATAPRAKAAKVLLELLENAPPYNDERPVAEYPEALALEGLLSEKDIGLLKRWLARGYKNVAVPVYLLGTIPGPRAEKELFELLDEQAETVDFKYDFDQGLNRKRGCVWVEALIALLGRDGVRIERELVAHVFRYPRPAAGYLAGALIDRWEAYYYDYDAGEHVQREMTAEERELYEEVKAEAAAKGYELPGPYRAFIMPPD